MSPLSTVSVPDASRRLCLALFARPDALADALRHHLRQPLHVTPHRHRDLFQLDVILDCDGRAWASGKWQELRGVSLLATYPGEEHGYRLQPTSPDAENFLIKLRLPPAEPAIAGRLFPEVLTGQDRPAALIDAIETAVRLASLQTAPSALLLAKVAETLAVWPKSRPDDAPRLPLLETGAPAELAGALRLIDNRLDAPPSVAELARETHLSERHFSRRFRATFGCTPHQFITARRLDFARQLLREKQLSITETAERLGFSTLPGFSRWFTHSAGLSPSAFQSNPELF